ncbi:RloB family protein [Actinoplanes missouriensis]|uniref:RloB family protein n=1 Tax=Actinoplanes missouriensis TaxID=1866 RepID=UPI0033FCC6A8
MSRRENADRRGRSRRPARPRLLVVCGAARTEEQYLQGLRDSIPNRAVDIAILKRPKDPAEVVRYAVQHARRATGDFDEIWCVFDVDEFDIRPAQAEARRHDVHLGISNPCFEFWLLLHHDDCRNHLTGYQQVVTRLRRFVPRYDKAELRFGDYAGGVQDAVTRARRLDRGPETCDNPSTGVWRLAERIMKEEGL